MKTKVSDRKALLHLAVRILTLPPIVIGVTLLLMYAPTGLLTRRELLLCEVFLLVIPLAAYPLREIFHIGKDRRRGQRGTALVCSAVGYLCGFLWSMLTPCSWLVHILFLSYAISIAALFLLNSPKRYTVSLTIYSFCSQKKSDWNLLFANITLISLPIIAIYCFLQKYIVSGMTAGAVKG